MGAVRSTEPSVNLYWITRRHTIEDDTLNHLNILSLPSNSNLSRRPYVLYEGFPPHLVKSAYVIMLSRNTYCTNIYIHL
jgi:hypothetical protein